MKHLWRKESKKPSALYLDLFNVPSGASSFQVVRADPKTSATAEMFHISAKKLFDVQKYAEAIEQLNESILHAPLGCAMLASSYVARAVCYLFIREYDHCLVDIVHGIKAKYPAELMAALNSIKDQCMKNRAKVPVTKRNLELSYPANDSIPCMANVLEIQHNDEFGRHIVANCDIPAGKTIIIEPVYIAATTAATRAATICSTCQRIRPNLLPCESCTVAMYCSAECKKQGSVYHAIECGYDFFHTRCYLYVPQYLIRSILIGINACGGVDELMAFVERVRKEPMSILTSTIEPLDQYRAFLQHLHNISDREHCFKTATVAYRVILTLPDVAKLFDTLAKRRFLMHLIVLHDVIIAENGFKWRGDFGNILNAMYTTASLINYKCVPNVIATNIEGKQGVFTIRPIKQGEQLFLANTKLKSRQEFFDVRGYWCDCSKCVPVDIPADVLSAITDDLKVVGETHVIIAESRASVKDVKEKCINFMNKNGHLEYFASYDYIVNLFMSAIYVEHVHIPQ